MNKILLKTAAAVNIAAAAIIYIACSGDDGKDGSVCTGVETATGVNIVCDGNVVGTVKNGQSAPGTEGTCTVIPGAGGSLNANCGGQTYPLGGGAGGGGCTIADGDAYYILTCGTTPMQIAKAWCAGVPYNPSKNACDQTTGEISENRCGNMPIDLDRQFCSANKIYPICGIWTLKPDSIGAPGKIESYDVKGKQYNPLTEFCAPNIYLPTANTAINTLIKAVDTVYTRCGTAVAASFAANSDIFHSTESERVAERKVGYFDPQTNFCYVSSTGALDPRGRCDNTKSDPNTKSDGLSYSSDETCVVVPSTDPPALGTVQGTCDGKSYTSDEFCHKGLTIHAKCDTSTTTSAKVSYDVSTSFCSPAQNGKEKILPLCGASTAAVEDRMYNSILQFCSGTGAVATPKLLCGAVVSAGSGSGVTGAPRVVSASEYTGTNLLNTVTGKTYKKFKLALNASFELIDRGESYEPITHFCGQYKEEGASSAAPKVLEKCGSATDPTWGEGGYDGEAKYCVSGTATNLITCGAGSYNPNLEICDTRTDANNKRYKIKTINGVTWMVQNLEYAGTGTVGKEYGKSSTDKSAYSGVYGRLYSSTEAPTVCPTGYKLPDDTQWSTLSAAASGSADKLKSASTRKNTTATVNSVSTNLNWSVTGSDTLGFDALPSGRGVFTPEYEIPASGDARDADEILWTQARSAAYWWSATASPTAGKAKYWNLLFNNDNISQGEGSIYTDFYSVRCVKSTN